MPLSKVDKKHTGCNLKTTKLLDCALIGVCAVIRLNTVSPFFCVCLRSAGRMSKSADTDRTAPLVVCIFRVKCGK